MKKFLLAAAIVGILALNACFFGVKAMLYSPCLSLSFGMRGTRRP